MTVTTKISFEHFMRAPGTKPASEWACGEVVQKPMPTVPHSMIQGYFILTLGPFLHRTGIGWIFPELRCIFGPTGRERIFVPDLVYIARERLPSEQYLYAPPDLAIEILSPEQPMARFSDKIQFYLLNGVRLVRVIDPIDRTVAALAPGQEPRVLSSGDTLDGGDVLPGFSVAVDDIFAQMLVSPR
jgi:Uma2 family endonuclease